VTYGYAGDVGDGIERAGCTVKRNAKIASAGFDRIFFLRFVLNFILCANRGSA
jgi:hypothetical protein